MSFLDIDFWNFDLFWFSFSNDKNDNAAPIGPTNLLKVKKRGAKCQWLSLSEVQIPMNESFRGANANDGGANAKNDTVDYIIST